MREEEELERHPNAAAAKRPRAGSVVEVTENGRVV